MSGYAQRPSASRPPSQQQQQQQQFNRHYDDSDDDSESSSSDQEPATMAFVEENLVFDDQDQDRVGGFSSNNDKDKDLDRKLWQQVLDLNSTTKSLHDLAVLAEAEAQAENELLLQEITATSPNHNDSHVNNDSNNDNNMKKRAAPSPSHGDEDDDDDDNAKQLQPKHARKETTPPPPIHQTAARKRWNAVSLRKEVAETILGKAEIQLQKAQQLIQDGKLELEQAQKDYVTAGDELCPVLCREESETWHAHYQNLLVFIDMEGHAIVPMNANQGWKNKFPTIVGLARWVKLNRKEYANGTLKAIYVKALNKVNFDWNPCETRWMKMYQHLRDYKQEHGTTRVPYVKTETETDEHSNNQNNGLGAWVKRQQYQWSLFQEGKKSCEITQERIQLLDDLGMVWRRRDESWTIRYKELLEFQKQHGHVLVPEESNKSLYEWQSTQRAQWKSFQQDPLQSTLTHNQVQMLVAVGMENDIRETKWRVRFQDLKEFQKKHGHTIVPLRYAFCPKLGEWTASLRRQYKKNLQGKPTPLTKERMTLLTEIGFDFTVESSEREKIQKTIQKTWDESYAELLQVQKPYGFIIKNLDDPDLQAWAQEQRQDYAWFQAGRTSLLTEDRIKKLRELNFDFEYQKKRIKSWDELYAEIMEHYLLEQSFAVKPLGNPLLYEWKVEQQEEYQKYTSGEPSKLTSAKIEMLLAIKFPFNMGRKKRGKKKILFNRKSWEELYSELLVFLMKHNDFNVPEKEFELWTWCAEQRKAYRPDNNYDDKQILDRIEKLKKIEFPFLKHLTLPKATTTPIPILTPRVDSAPLPPAWPYPQYPAPHPEVARLAAAAGDGPPPPSKYHPPVRLPVTSQRGRAPSPGPYRPPTSARHRDTHAPPYFYSEPWPPPVYPPPPPRPHSKTASLPVPPGGAPAPSKTIPLKPPTADTGAYTQLMNQTSRR